MHIICTCSFLCSHHNPQLFCENISSISHWVAAMYADDSTLGFTLDQHHTGLMQVGNSSMGTHTGSKSHWVEAG